MDVRAPVARPGSAGGGGPLDLPGRPAGPIRVSVIIPCYNAAETLDTPLESLVAQTCPDWEAILVDDGSTDDTLKVAEQWVARDSRFRIVRQAQAGVSAARNAGIAAARYDWISFLDADDRLAPDFFSVMTGALRRCTDADAALCKMVHVESDGLEREIDFWIPTAAGSCPWNCPVLIHACVVRRDLVRAVGGFDTGLKTAEDWDLWLRLFRVGARFVPVRKHLAYYVARSDSASRNLLQATRDGAVVLTRIYGEDPRLGPAALLVPDEPFELTVFLHLADKAGMALGQGDDPRTLVPLAGLCRSPTLSAKQFGDRLAGAIIWGSAAHSWPAREAWLAAGSRIPEMLSDLETLSGAEGFAAKALNTAEALLAERDDQPEPVLIGRACGIPLDAGSTIRDMVLPDGAARALVRFNLGAGGGVAVQLAAIDGRISGRKVAREIARQTAAGMVRRLFARRPWRRPGLFLRFLLSAAGSRPIECVVQLARARRDCRRAILVSYLRDAARRFVGSGAVVRADASCAPVPAMATVPGLEPVAGLAPVWQPFTRRIPVLMYHSIADDGPPGLAQYRTAPGAFAAQMKWLADNGYRTITPDDWFAAWQARCSFRDRVALITFDDGFADFRANAWPALDRHGFTATVFVVAGLVGGVSEWDSAYGETMPLMTWPEIRDMSDRGIVFGSHSMYHRPLGGRDFGELVEEEREVSKRIADSTGQPVSTMAYPHGDLDPVVRQAVERAGYRTAFTTRHGLSNYRDEPMEIPRVEIRGGDSLEVFAARVSETAALVSG